MEAAKLFHRVKFQKLDTSLDGFGQPTNVWINAFTVWGEVADMSGAELIKSMALSAEATARITIRYRAGMDASMRAIWNGVIYNIKAPPIDSTGRKRELVLLCQRGLQHDPATTSAGSLLTEDGFYLLTEDGFRLLLES